MKVQWLTMFNHRNWKLEIPGENLMSDISDFLWWKCAISSKVSVLTTAKLPGKKIDGPDQLSAEKILMIHWWEIFESLFHIENCPLNKKNEIPTKQ